MNPQDAAICALASEAIYGLDPEAGVKNAIQPFGFSSFECINFDTIADDICVVIASSPKANLVCFRGTKLFQDWLTDLHASPLRFEWIFSGGPTIGEIHAGFGHCLESRLDQIYDAVAASPGKPLIITGHSLGGALAAILGTCFTVYDSCLTQVNRIYTFGQPRIGLHNFCNTYDQILRGKLLRFINSTDIVPRVPPRGFDYGDEGAIVHFDSGGKALIESEEWNSFLARAIGSLEDVGEILANWGPDARDHDMETYRKLVQQNTEQLSKLFASNQTYSQPCF